MKFLLPAVAVMLIAGCSPNMTTHRKDFSTCKPQGAWTDYYGKIRKGEQPEPPKELKDR